LLVWWFSQPKEAPKGASLLILIIKIMSKAKRIKLLKEFIKLEKKEKEPKQEYIDWANEEITKLENYLKKERQRTIVYLTAITLNKKKRKTAYENRKLIKTGVRESYRQRKIKLNKECRNVLKAS